jgi:hypothetical protein
MLLYFYITIYAGHAKIRGACVVGGNWQTKGVTKKYKEASKSRRRTGAKMPIDVHGKMSIDVHAIRRVRRRHAEGVHRRRATREMHACGARPVVAAKRGTKSQGAELEAGERDACGMQPGAHWTCMVRSPAGQIRARGLEQKAGEI